MEIVDHLGYWIEDIRRELGPRFSEFERWFEGQTGAISTDDRLLVYPWDYQRFLRGQGPLD